MVSYTATTDNVAVKDAVRIDLFRWSTEAERDQMMTAWTKPGTPAAGAARGRGPRALDASDPALAGVGGGGRGRGGRGGRGGDAAPAAPPTPEKSLATALDQAPTVGNLWTSEVAGYSLRYAVKTATPDGGERVVFITERRLGAWNDSWKPASGAPSNYEFSVIELHLNAKGEGEGRASLTGKVAVDSAAKTLALEDYNALPVVLKNVKRK